ncbi:hypothetical protein [Erythrobacter mangrovi]|uniref:Lipoprotein n=1 Tax=Erythrobacter mangrovi TaxID=2739433 RepID=A0A7D4B7Y8_9SPHN|nr:hypothetical protein [Erythrobacter mangrovi]QKG71363.1 hypothetical protein HQR01_08275 [Erythrobacter mangrovi]
MKPIFAHLAGAIALTFAIAACVPAPQTAPAPAPTPTPVAQIPAPAPPPAPMPAETNWIDAPQSRGAWSYAIIDGGTIARFAEAGGDPLFTIACTANDRRVTLTRHSQGTSAGTAMTIRTEKASRTLAAGSTNNRDSATAALAARDPLLDAMALTSGRFAVEMAGTPALYLPNWAEVTRVIEDCR